MRTWGSELSLKAHYAKNLVSEISAAYQVTTYFTEDQEDIAMAMAPVFLGNLKISYRFKGIMSVALKGRYVDEMLSPWDISSNKRFSEAPPGYFLLDANIRANLSNGIYLNLMASNITNTEIRYVSDQNFTWSDLGMVGYCTRLQVTAGYKF